MPKAKLIIRRLNIFVIHFLPRECGQLARGFRIRGQAARTPGEENAFFVSESKCICFALLT